MATTADEVWQLLGELVQAQKETERRFNEQQEETDRRFKKTDRQIQELGKQIGGLGKKFGSFTEGLALPSMETILFDQFGMEVVTPIAKVTNQQAAFQTIYRTRQELLNQPVAKSFLLDRLRPEDAIDTVEQYLPQLPIPTQVIAGEQDTTIPLWHCQTYADQLPLATLAVFPDAGHDLIQTHSTEIAQTIHHQLDTPTR